MPDQTRGQRSVVWTLAALTTVSYGTLYYAQPLLAVAAEHERGWTRTQTGFAFTLALLVTALIAPAVGRALDARGGQVLVGGGAVLGGLAFVLLACTSNYLLFVTGWLLAERWPSPSTRLPSPSWGSRWAVRRAPGQR